MAITPITRYGKFTPTGVDQTEARKLEALAGVGQKVTQAAVAFGKQKIQEEQKKADLAYKAYALESYSVIDDHIQDAQTTNPSDSIAFQSALDSKMKGMIDSAPEQVRFDLENYYRKASKSAFKNVQTLEKKKQDSKLLAQLNVGTEALANLAGNSARAGNNVESLEAQLEYQENLLAGVDSGLLTAVEAQNKISTLEDEIAIQTQEGQVDRAIFDSEINLKTRAEKGLELVGALRKAPLAQLSAKQNDVLLKRLETKVNAVVKEYNDSVKVSDAEVRKSNGIANVRARVSGDVPATSDVITDNDIDNDYNVERLNFKTAPELLMDDRIDYATSVRAVPKTMKTEILSDLRSNDPDRVLVAAQSIMEINALDGMPEAFTGQDVVYADTLYRNMEFYEFGEALERAKAIAFPSSSTQKSMIETRKSELSLDKPKRNEMYADKLESAYTGIFGFGDQFTPNNIERDAMIADLRTLAEDNYLLGFETLDGAIDHSLQKMKNSYKVGEFGFLQHAPETFYGLGPTKDTSWIRQSLHEELVAKYGDGFAPEDIILVSDTETATMAKKRTPTYQAFIRMSDGSLQPVDDRVDPSVDYPAVLEKYNKDIKEKAEVPILDKRQFLSDHKMTPDQNARAREILQGSTNPFALVGKAIGSIDDAPEFVAKYFKKSLNEVLEPVEFVASEVSKIPQDVLNWNEQYIAALQKASGKEDIEITIADLSN